MPTNDERREVSARLREQKTWDICTEYEYCIGDICDAVFEDDGNLNDMFRLQIALADLIEPEPERTCHMAPTFTGPAALRNIQEYECSKCGKSTLSQMFGDDEDVPKYCQNCGARVTKVVE